MTHALLRARLLLAAGVDDRPPGWARAYAGSREALRASQWSRGFEEAMRVRLEMGAFRYGPFRAQGRGTHRNVESAIRRLRRYLRDGNQEDLVDAANLCMVEFVSPGSHPAPHWSPVDDGEEKVEVNKSAEPVR